MIQETFSIDVKIENIRNEILRLNNKKFKLINELLALEKRQIEKRMGLR